MRPLRRPPVWRVLVLLLAGAGLIGARLHKRYAWEYRWLIAPRVLDEVGLLDKEARVWHERQLELSSHESGVDVRYLLVATTAPEAIEAFSVRRARELGMGRESDRAGVLIVYDTLARRMRIEVGPMLQGSLPDGFVGYIVREHNRSFFGHRQPELGLRLTLFMLDWRLREARLGEEYDPAFERYIEDVRRLANGGGASGSFEAASRDSAFINRPADSVARRRFAPQPTVEGTYRRYLEWMALGGGETDVPLFTAASQRHLAALPLTRAFNSAMLALEYGKAYAIDVRGDLAMLYYTGTPFRSPLFLRRTSAGWEMDLIAEIANTQEIVGNWYSWTLVDSGDEYSRTFADRYFPIHGTGFEEFYRVAGGDNRWMMVRSTRRDRPRSQGSLGSAPDAVVPSVGQLTVHEVAHRLAAAADRPVVLLLYDTGLAHIRQQFGDIVGLANLARELDVAFLAFSTDNYGAVLDQLPSFLEAHAAPFPPVHIYSWKPGVLDAMMARFGISVGHSWRPPLVVVRDRAGRIVAQGQGVTDWHGVRSAVRSVAH
ncbi:MAG: TPM domain-containing protein [Gemmatimonadales bacterium]